MIRPSGDPRSGEPAAGQPGERIPSMVESMASIMNTFAVIDELLLRITGQVIRLAHRDAARRDRRTLG